MSEMERNKGVLHPVNVDAENFSEEDFDTYRENGYLIIDGGVYQPQYEVKSSSEVPEFVEVNQKEDGSIEFHTYHYNGGACLEEVIQGGLK